MPGAIGLDQIQRRPCASRSRNPRTDQGAARRSARSYSANSLRGQPDHQAALGHDRHTPGHQTAPVGSERRNSIRQRLVVRRRGRQRSRDHRHARRQRGWEVTIRGYRLPDGTIPVLLSSNNPALLPGEAAALRAYAVGHPEVDVQAIAGMLFRTRVARKHRVLAMVTNREEMLSALQAVTDGIEHPAVIRTDPSAT